MAESLQGLADMLRTPKINVQAGVWIGFQVVHEVGADFDRQQTCSPGQGPQDGLGGAAGAGPELHYRARMGDVADFDNSPF